MSDLLPGHIAEACHEFLSSLDQIVLTLNTPETSYSQIRYGVGPNSKMASDTHHLLGRLGKGICTCSEMSDYLNQFRRACLGDETAPGPAEVHRSPGFMKSAYWEERTRTLLAAIVYRYVSVSEGAPQPDHYVPPAQKDEPMTKTSPPAPASDLPDQVAAYAREFRRCVMADQDCPGKNLIHRLNYVQDGSGLDVRSRALTDSSSFDLDSAIEFIEDIKFHLLGLDIADNKVLSPRPVQVWPCSYFVDQEGAALYAELRAERSRAEEGPGPLVKTTPATGEAVRAGGVSSDKISKETDPVPPTEITLGGGDPTKFGPHHLESPSALRRYAETQTERLLARDILAFVAYIRRRVFGESEMQEDFYTRTLPDFPSRSLLHSFCREIAPEGEPGYTPTLLEAYNFLTIFRRVCLGDETRLDLRSKVEVNKVAALVNESYFETQSDQLLHRVRMAGVAAATDLKRVEPIAEVELGAEVVTRSDLGENCRPPSPDELAATYPAQRRFRADQAELDHALMTRRYRYGAATPQASDQGPTGWDRVRPVRDLGHAAWRRLPSGRLVEVTVVPIVSLGRPASPEAASLVQAFLTSLPLLLIAEVEVMTEEPGRSEFYTCGGGIFDADEPATLAAWLYKSAAMGTTDVLVLRTGPQDEAGRADLLRSFLPDDLPPDQVDWSADAPQVFAPEPEV